MSTRKKADESEEVGFLIDKGTNDPALPPIEALLPVATDTPSVFPVPAGMTPDETGELVIMNWEPAALGGLFDCA